MSEKSVENGSSIKIGESGVDNRVKNPVVGLGAETDGKEKRVNGDEFSDSEKIERARTLATILSSQNVEEPERPELYVEQGREFPKVEDLEEYFGPKTPLEKFKELPWVKKTLRLVAGVLVFFSLHPVAAAETRQDANIKANIGTKIVGEVVPGQQEVKDQDPTIAALESIGWSTEGYINRLEKIAVNKEKLLAFGEHKDRLDACAEIRYSIEMCDGFKDSDVFDKWQDSILSNFISTKEIDIFYETGDLDSVDEYCKKELGRDRNWDPIYFKDKNDKSTGELAMIYVYNPENKHFKVGDIEDVINTWEKWGAEDFLGTLVVKNVRVILQSQASSNENVQLFKYGYQIVFWNYSGNDLTDFQSGLQMGLGVEPNGVRGEVLEGEKKSDIVGLLKARIACDDCEYLLANIDNKTVSSFDKRKLDSLLKKYQAEVVKYTQKYWINKGKSVEELEALYSEMKDKGLITLFGADN
jgi:hypothetical protein